MCVYMRVFVGGYDGNYFMSHCQVDGFELVHLFQSRRIVFALHLLSNLS